MMMNGRNEKMLLGNDVEQMHRQRTVSEM